MTLETLSVCSVIFNCREKILQWGQGIIRLCNKIGNSMKFFSSIKKSLSSLFQNGFKILKL